MPLKARIVFNGCIVLLTSSALGCTTQPSAQCAAGERATDAQRIWQEHRPRDYEFVWQRNCFCLPDAVQPIRISVRDGEIIAATDLAGTPVSATVRQGLETIDQLYEHVVSAERAGAKVRFECAGTGIPQQVYVDPNPGRADDEFRVTISQFTAGADAPGAASIH